MWATIFFGTVVSYVILAGDGNIFSATRMSWVILLAVGAYWLYFFSDALRQNRRAAYSVDKVERVISTGVYGIVRHPIYSADMLLSWAAFLIYPTWWLLGGVIWLHLVMLFWIQAEEAALTEKFGDEYTRYKKSVPMIIPFFHT